MKYDLSSTYTTFEGSRPLEFYILPTDKYKVVQI